MSDEINPVTGRPVRKSQYRDPMVKLDRDAFEPRQEVKAEPDKKPAAPRKKEPAPRKTGPKGQGSSVVPSLTASDDAGKKKSTFVWDRDTLAEVEKWLEENPGHTVTSMLYCGMKSLGIEVADHLLVPVRKRGRKYLSK